MTDSQKSPYAGLDKALLRSTQRPGPRAEPERQETEPAAPPQAPDTPAAKPRQAGEEASTIDSKPASEQASTLARRATSYPNSLIQAIRKTVKLPGKEVSFVRVTPDEKAQLAEIVYNYKRRGKKTTENEINRIAVNFILEDHRANGETSVLARVIDALLA